MRYYYSILFIIFQYFLVHSQIQIEPKEYSKIIYSYHKKSNYIVNEKGIYADTILLKMDLPNKKFVKVKSPVDSLKIVGYIPLYNIDDNDKLNLKRNILKCYSKINVIFDLKKKQAKIVRWFGNENDFPPTLKKLLNIDYKEVESPPSLITYHDNFMMTVQNKIENTTESYESNKIKWVENTENTGVFEHVDNLFTYKSVVIVDKSLSKYIVPTTLFSNCDYGVSKIIALPYTIDLFSVSYK